MPLGNPFYALALAIHLRPIFNLPCGTLYCTLLCGTICISRLPLCKLSSLPWRWQFALFFNFALWQHVNKLF